MSDADAELLMRLAVELEDAPLVRLDLAAGDSLALVACLQLALRHPAIPAGPAEVARRVIDEIAQRSGPAASALIEAGDDPAADEVVYRVPSADWLADRLLVERGGMEHMSDAVAAIAALGENPASTAQRELLDHVTIGPEAGVVHYHGPPGQPLVPDAVLDRALAAADETVARARSLLDRLDVDVDERIPPDTFVVISGDPAHPERGGDAVVRRVDSPALPDVIEEGRRPLGVVRPAGLVWSGIRVDEMERLYEVLGPDHEACPVKLEDGEIYGDPPTGRVWVWSLADFRRLADLSRFLHELRRRGLRTPLTASERELGERWQAAIRAANTGAPALDVLRALPAGGES
jgi:hypothetical protein